MAASEAMLGYGTIFRISNNDSPGVYTDIAEVFNITPPSFEADDVDVTHNQSPNRTRETIAGLKTPGDCSFEMNFIPGSASDVLIRALLGSGEQRACQIEYPNAETWDFLAAVKGYEISAATDDKMTATVSMQVSGDVTAST
jgi:predicted secreted protein